MSGLGELFFGFREPSVVERGIARARAAQYRAEALPELLAGARVMVFDEFWGSITPGTVYRTGLRMYGDKFRVLKDGRSDDQWEDRWACRTAPAS